MKWPWHRDRDLLTDARRERAKVEQDARNREPTLRRLEKHKREDPFAAQFRKALGGSQ